MKERLGRIVVRQRTGSERFKNGDRDLGFDVLSFWRWSASDLVSNTMRGVLAEYLVARALGMGDGGVRDGWAAYDLVTKSNVNESTISVEVKSAAYLQSWHQEKESSVLFRIPKTLAWDPATSVFETDAKRQADVYVFALLAHREDKTTLDPLDVSQWKFFVLPTRAINARSRSQHSITLASLESLSRGSVSYDGLLTAVSTAAMASAPSPDELA